MHARMKIIIIFVYLIRNKLSWKINQKITSPQVKNGGMG